MFNLYSYWSHDLGGHVPGIIEPELYVRWMLYPSPYSQYLRDAIIRRYELVPYIYTECRNTVDNGVSLCYPLYYDHPEEENAYAQNEVFKFGRNMIVSPVVAPADKTTLLSGKSTWLPEGNFFDTVRGCTVKGSTAVTDKYMMNEIPVFVTEGAIIPAQRNAKRLDDVC